MAGVLCHPSDGEETLASIAMVTHRHQEVSRQALSAQAPDPADLQRANWELTPFYCPECSQNYCRADWHPDVLFGQSYYDCTMATCPSGHQHMVDD